MFFWIKEYNARHLYTVKCFFFSNDFLEVFDVFLSIQIDILAKLCYILVIFEFTSSQNEVIIRTLF